MTIATDFAGKLQDKLNAQAAADRASDHPYKRFATDYRFTVEPGRAYDRIVQENVNKDGQTGNRHVHAFVTKDGKLVKAATWQAPQKGKDGLAVRFDLATPEGMAEAIEAADFAGGYLYKH